MALIHIYNGIDEKTTYTFNGKLKDFTKADLKNSIILCGGKKIDENYEIKKNDIIFIRKTPTAAAGVIIGIIGGLLLTASVIVAGVQIYNNIKKLNEMEEAAKAAKEASAQANKLPFIRGGRNTIATGQTFPYAMGKSLMTPYILCSPHYTISGTNGETQYYNTVLEVAYRDILIHQIKMGETVIKDFTAETEPQNGVYAWDFGNYYDDNNIIEIRQQGDFQTEDFNKKIILTELSQEIPHRHATDDAEENRAIEKEWKEGVIQELPTNAKKVQLIVLLDGLQKYTDDGVWDNQEIKLNPQWTSADNPTENDWVNFDAKFMQNGRASNTFSYNTRKQMRFILTQEFTPAQAYKKNIKIRIQRTTPKAENNARDNIYLLAIQTEIYDARKSSTTELKTAKIIEDNERDKCCRLGIRVKATRNNEGLLESFSVIETACARIWNGTEWSETRTPTRNLGAWVYEVMTSPHHEPSRYNDEEIDTSTMGELYEYCERMGFYADGIITRGVPKKQILETLLKNANASLVYNSMTGLIEVAIDNGRDYSVALLNSENIVSISTSKEYKRRADGIKIKYINESAGYDIDSVIFMRNGGEYEPENQTLTESALEYVTDYEQAYKIAWRQMAEENVQQRIITVKAGLESAYYPLYSRVEVQHRSLKNGKSHGVINSLVWNNNYLTEIILDGSVNFSGGKNYGIIINCVSDSGRGLLPLKVSGTGRTNRLEVTTLLHHSAAVIPDAGNVVSFGELDKNGDFTTVTQTMKIINSEETDNGYILTLTDYNPELYEYGTIPDYKSNIINRPNSNVQTVEDQREYITESEAQANAAGAAQAAVDTITRGIRFTNVYKIKPAEMSLEDIIAKIDDDARKTSASISISANEILLQVDDMERELTGLIDIQAGAVTALVEGGGSAGQMSLSLNLPVIIDAATRNKLINASNETKVNAVYGLIDKSNYYGIKPAATDSEIKSLWDDAVAAKLLASQIQLQADQILIDGDVIVNEENKIKAALIDVESILVKNIAVKDKGVIRSNNYNGVIDDNGVINTYGTQGWAVDNAGNSDFVNINATGGNFTNVNVSGKIEATDSSFNGTLNCGSLKVLKTTTYTNLKQFTTSDSIYQLYNYLQGRGAGTITKTVAALFINFANPVMLYGNTVVNNVRLYTTRQTMPFLATFYHVVFNGDIDIYDAIGQDVQQIMLAQNWVVKYSIGEKLTFMLEDLPTSQPVDAGIVWRDGNTLKIS